MQRAVLAVLVISACGGGGKSGIDADLDVLPPPIDAAPCNADGFQAPTARAHTTSGTIRGKQIGDVWSFFGVPYAQQPTGVGRFASARGATCSPIELDATVHGPKCPQLAVDGTTVLGREECLQLSIWAPDGAPSTPRAVMVWFHGGANAVGDAADPLYDGAKLARAGDVIVVSVSYRLGQLGFLSSFGLQGQTNSPGAYGISDQAQAVLWVRDNIQAFGGDPENITIFGSGAGATDACAMIAMQIDRPPFQRAILQSAECGALPDFNVASQTGETYTSTVGCQSFDTGCLRGKSLAQLLTALPPSTSLFPPAGAPIYQPPTSTTMLPFAPLFAIQSGMSADVSLLVGSNLDEVAADAPAIATEIAYENALAARYGQPFADEVRAKYPAASYASPRAAFIRAVTDQRFACPSRELAKAHADVSTRGTFRYQFAAPAGAIHGAEVAYVFGNFDAWPSAPTAADLALSAAMQADWTSFARTGEPAWPPWDPTDPVRVYADTVTVQSGAGAQRCDFWRDSGF